MKNQTDPRVQELIDALRPFAENWDLAAAPYLNDGIDGECARVLTKRTFDEMLRAIDAARDVLARVSDTT